MLLAKDVSFVSDVILSNLSGRRKRSATGFLNVNCPMCHRVGNHRPDTKMRCGIMITPTNIGVTCFNCHFKTGFVLGQTFGRSFKDFLDGLGLDDIRIKRLNHIAFTYKHMLEASGIEVEAAASFVPTFPSMALPEGSRSFEALAVDGCGEQDFLDVVEYTYGRGEDLASSTKFYWTPNTKDQMNRRVIIPFYHEEKIVGYTARLIDAGQGASRYYMKSPLNYLFNNHVLKHRNRAFITVQEGALDALAIDGIGTLGAKLNDQQAQWLKSTGKQIIIVPDRDESGQALIDVALKHSWWVAFPRNYWEPDVKDVAEAVKRYGRLYTLTSILKSATNQIAQINVLRRLNP